MRYRIFRAGRLTRRFRVGLIGLVALLIAGTTTVLVSASSTEASSPTPYIALGDSIAFGSTAPNSATNRNPNNAVGYPDYVGAALRFTTVNASCPGETTGGFISTDGSGRDCSLFKANFPLHVSYAGTQLDYASAFLDAHPSTRLVTVGIGLSDVFMLGVSCGGTESPQACFDTSLPSVLATIASNTQLILERLGGTGFHGVLMVVNNYSVDYSDPARTALTEAVNDTVSTVAHYDGAVVADAFSAFRTAAATPFAGNSTCKAGLLNTSRSNQLICDSDPSQSGQQLLAHTVQQAYAMATSHPPTRG